MNKPLHCLIVEDSEDDAFLLQRELGRAGYDVTWSRVETAEAMRAELERASWDVILSDYKMPRFSGMAALELFTASGLDIPFIIASGAIDEGVAVTALKSGASDYVMKNNLARLGSAVERELHEVENRRKTRQAGEERQSLHAQLLQAQKLESIGTLAGGVAHEINNPVMAIMNYAQLILDKLGPDSPVSEFATEIGRETERVATIVKNLLAFARYEKHSQSPARMHDIVDGTLSLIRAVMRNDQITLDADAPADLPQVRCRTQQIQQVIMNLLTNTRDALNQKYPAYDENKKVIITARQIQKEGRRWIRLTVEDHGPGIPDDLRERIFDPFFTTKPRDKGTGLGLAISHGIVKDHGGELWVESEVGQWTRFHMDLPVGEAGN